jgi:hypothetical protein
MSRIWRGPPAQPVGKFAEGLRRVAEAMINLERKLKTAREQTPAVLFRHYPATALRILAGKARRSSSDSPGSTLKTV